jgi:hypothetical protein
VISDTSFTKEVKGPQSWFHYVLIYLFGSEDFREYMAWFGYRRVSVDKFDDGLQVHLYRKIVIRKGWEYRMRIRIAP